MRFDGAKVDWGCDKVSKLWRYNLHYFDYLGNSDRTDEEKGRLIDDWIQNNPIGSGDGWEPYTVSLRICNWIKLFCRPAWQQMLRQHWLDSLYQQALWLESNIEYHILANHYLKNGKALFFAGAVFDGSRAKRWLARGRKILLEEAKEQMLADGGHYERSPMYHCIVLEDYLDVLNLAQKNPGLLAAADVAFLRDVVSNGLKFIHDISFTNERFPLFNDAALGIAPTPGSLYEYAARVFDWRREARAEALAVVEKAQSGYYVIRDGKDMMVVDCGAVGPDYQPGHAHCDALSFELMLDGQMVVVDSGVHDYESGDLRSYVRGTAAHNTVMVDSQEQSEVWGTFRVARRAYPTSARLVRNGATGAQFEGGHDGYLRFGASVIHSRKIDYDRNTGWIVSDTVAGIGRHTVQSFIHVHPDLTASVEGRCIALRGSDSRVAASIAVGSPTVDIELKKGWHCPEFGRKYENDVVALSATGSLPITISYQIAK